MAVRGLPQTILPAPAFRKRVEQRSGEKVSSCFQCEKCTNGCPVTFAMDIEPHKLMRCVQMGLKDEVLNSDTIWVCASCETCTARCPNNIDIAHIMDSLRQISQEEGIRASQKDIPVFHAAFLGSVKRHGRVHEPTMAAVFALKSGGLSGLMRQAGMGFELFRKGKIRILPSRLRSNKAVRDIFKTAEREGKS